MITMRQLFALLIILFVNYTFGQNDYYDDYNHIDFRQLAPSSPSTAALEKYAKIPVSYYTGVPNINIPFYTIKTRDIEVPISISYHSNGIKVYEDASNVGLGWAFNAGGVISRQTMGAADDDNLFFGPSPSSGGEVAFHDIGYFFSSTPVFKLIEGQDYDGYTNRELKFRAASGSIDVSSDIYSFKFGKHSGRFIFNKDGEAISLNKSNLKIVPGNIDDRGFVYFEIIDEDGIIYKFEEREYRSSASEMEDWINNPQQDGDSPFDFNTWNFDNYNDDIGKKRLSAWYLTKISSQSTGEEVNFVYNPVKEFTGKRSGIIETSYWKRYVTRRDPYCMPGGPDVDKYTYCYLRNNTHYHNFKPRLEEINWSKGKIILEYNQTDREDVLTNTEYGQLGAKALKKILLKKSDHLNWQQVKSFELFFSYFLSPGYNEADAGDKYAYCRLKLD